MKQHATNAAGIYCFNKNSKVYAMGTNEVGRRYYNYQFGLQWLFSGIGEAQEKLVL